MSSWLQFHTMLIHCLVYCVCCEFRHLHLLTPLLNPETLVSPNSLCVHSPSCPLPFRSPLLPDEHRTQLWALQCASDLTRWWRREESYLPGYLPLSCIQCSSVQRGLAERLVKWQPARGVLWGMGRIHSVSAVVLDPFQALEIQGWSRQGRSLFSWSLLYSSSTNNTLSGSDERSEVKQNRVLG